jgi:hypothetical protein
MKGDSLMRRVLFGVATFVVALIFAGSLATCVTSEAEAQQAAPAAQTSQAPAAEASGAQHYPMMRWHERMHGGQPPTGPMGYCPYMPGPESMGPRMMGGGMGMGTVSADPKLRAQMMQVQGEMMKKMGELMEQRAKELQSGK